jgi:hypothetical protein
MEHAAEGITGQTLTPLNGSNPDLTTTTPRSGETDVITGRFEVFFMSYEVSRIFGAL